MSFRKYATKVHALALETRDAAKKIESDYKRAEDARRTAGDPVSKARAEAAYQEALAAKNAWKYNKPAEIERQLAGIRAELEAAVDNTFSADPQQIDPATITLLESGILRASEYGRLMRDAVKSENWTMARLIGASAEKASETVAEKYGMTDVKARELRALAYQGKNMGGEVYLQNFGVLAETLNRSVKNPALFDKWEELTGEVIEKGF